MVTLVRWLTTWHLVGLSGYVFWVRLDFWLTTCRCGTGSNKKLAFFSHFGVLGVFIVQFSSSAVPYVGPRYTGHLLFDTLFLLSSPVSTLAVGRPISPSRWKRTTLFFVGMGVLHCMVCYFFCLVKS